MNSRLSPEVVFPVPFVETGYSSQSNQAAMKNGRCRMHGGLSTGPCTLEGLKRSRKANFKHGYYSAEMIAERKFIKQLLSDSRETLEQVEKNIESRVVF